MVLSLSLESKYFVFVLIVLFIFYVVYHEQSGNSISHKVGHIHRVLTNKETYPETLRRYQAFGLSNSPASPYQEDDELEWLDRSDAKPQHRDYGDGTCPQNANRLGYTYLLKNWTVIANTHKIRYFLDFGSLLGAWRNEDVIPYDLDTDIRVHNDDLERLFKLPIRVNKMSWDWDDGKVHLYFTRDWRLPFRFRTRFNCKGVPVNEHIDWCAFTDPIARLIIGNWHVDIFVYTDYHQTVKFLPTGQYAFKKVDLLPPVKCNFMGLQLRCPRKPLTLLNIYYGSNLAPNQKCINKGWVKA